MIRLKIVRFLLATVETVYFPLQQSSRSCLPLFAIIIRTSISRKWRHAIPCLVILLQRKQGFVRRSGNAYLQVLDNVSQYLPKSFREDWLPRRVLEVSSSCRSCRVLSNISWLLQSEPLLLAKVWWDPLYLHIGRQDVSDAEEVGSDDSQRRRPHDLQ